MASDSGQPSGHTSGEKELAPEMESHETSPSYASVVTHSHSKGKPNPKKGTKVKSTQSGSKTPLLTTEPPRQSQMVTLGKVPAGNGGAKPKDGSGIHRGLVDVTSFGEVHPSAMAKSTVSVPTAPDNEANSASFAATHPSREELLVNQSLVLENARLKAQVTELTKTVNWQLQSRISEDSLDPTLPEGVRNAFLQNEKMKARLRTLETQNSLMSGLVAKNTQHEAEYNSLMENYQKSIHDGSALQEKAGEANITVCMQVMETEKRDREIAQLQTLNKHANDELQKAVDSCLKLEKLAQEADSASKELKVERDRARDRVRGLKQELKDRAQQAKLQPSSGAKGPVVEMSDVESGMSGPGTTRHKSKTTHECSESGLTWSAQADRFSYAENSFLALQSRSETA